MDLADMYQFGQIRRAHRSVSQVASEVQNQREAQRDDNDNLNERIDRLTMLCEAMWNIISEHLELSEEELIRSLIALDKADGTADGVKTKKAMQCACGAMVHPRVPNCQFCGTPAPVRSSFDAV